MLGNNLYIGLIGPASPPRGGMATQTKQLKILLENEGVRVEFVQMNTPYSPEWISNIKGARAVFRLIPYIYMLWRSAGRVQLFHVMSNSGWSWYLFSTPAIWIAKFRGIPVVVNYRGGGARQFFDDQYAWVRPTLNRASIIAVPSGFLKDVFNGWDIQTQIVPNIIDLKKFVSNKRNANAFNINNLHIIVTRNLEKIYDIKCAILAFSIVLKKYPQSILTITGEGGEKNDLINQVKLLDIRDSVKFTGNLSHEKISDLYRNADILLNTSLVDNMPNSLLEAMASEVVIVSTNVGGIPYMVENRKSSLLVEPGEYRQIADALLYVIENDQERRCMITSAKKRVDNYSWDNIKKSWLNIYTDLVENNI